MWHSLLSVNLYWLVVCFSLLQLGLLIFNVLQDEKRKIVASAFGEDHIAGSGARLTIEDLKYIFLGS